MYTTSFARGDQIYYFNSSISKNEYNHVTFTVLRDVDIKIRGISDGSINFIALDEVNYQNWLDLMNYTVIHQTTISGEFIIRFLPSLPINSTLNMIFYNSGNNQVQIEIKIDEIESTIDETPIPILPIILSTAFIPLLYRKSIRSSLNS